MQVPEVVVIVANYNGATTLYKGRPIIDTCLGGLCKTNYDNYKIIVVDGCSTDNSVNHIKSKFRNVTVIKDPENMGVAASLNHGIRFASRGKQDKWFALFNNDIIISDRDWLSNIMAEKSKQDANEKVGIIGCKLNYPDGKIQHAGAVAGLSPYNRGRAEIDNGQYDKVEAVGAVTYAVVLISSATIKKIGLLDENFFMGYEDIDHCVRAVEAGINILYDGKVGLIHLEGFTNSAAKNKLNNGARIFASQRNYIYFAMKHFGTVGRIKAIFLALAGSIISIEGKDRKRGLSSIKLKDSISLRLWETVRAVIAGYKLYGAWIDGQKMQSVRKQ